MKKSTRLSLTSVVAVSILGIPSMGCSISPTSKILNTPKTPKLDIHSNSQQYIFINSVGIEPDVTSDKEMFDPENPTFKIYTTGELARYWRVCDIESIQCGSTILNINGDYKIKYEEDGVIVTILTPDKITKSLYIQPSVEIYGSFEHELDGPDAEKFELVMSGDPKYHQPLPDCLISVKEGMIGEDERFDAIEIWSGSKLLYEGTDYEFTLEEADRPHKAQFSIYENVIDNDIRIVPHIHIIGDVDFTVNLEGQEVLYLKEYVPKASEEFTFDDPLFALNFDNANKPTKDIVVTAKIGEEVVDPKNIMVDSKTKAVTIKTPSGIHDNLTVDIDAKPIDGKTPKEGFEIDSWDNLLAIMDWAKNDATLFCKMYNASSKKDFLGAIKTVSWYQWDHKVQLVSLDTFHLAADKNTRTTASSDYAWFTFRFINPLIRNKRLGYPLTTFFNYGAVFDDANYNCWYRCEVGIFGSHTWKSSTIRDMMLGNRNIGDFISFPDNFDDKNFFNHVKYVANWTRINSDDDEWAPDARDQYIRDRFFLPTAVELGMNYVKPYKSDSRLAMESTNNKPVFNLYQNQRWNWNGTEGQEQIKLYNYDGTGTVPYWVAVPASLDDKTGQNEQVGYIDENGLFKRQDMGNECYIAPCFCI